jgi:hypothetical protein
MAAGVAKDLDEEVGVAVDDFGWVGEAGCGVDVAVDGEDLGDGVEGAEVFAKDGEVGEAAGAGGLVAILDGGV